jgi:hypothetical protein
MKMNFKKGDKVVALNDESGRYRVKGLTGTVVISNFDSSIVGVLFDKEFIGGWDLDNHLKGGEARRGLFCMPYNLSLVGVKSWKEEMANEGTI